MSGKLVYRWLALSALCVLGCSGENNTASRNLNSGTGEVDSGEDAVDDASVEADGGDQELDDAGAPLDAASTGGDSGTVGGFSILVRVNGVASAGQRVFFQSALGALSSEHRTAADGTVSSAEAPATVTVLASIAGGLPLTRRLMTFEALVTGDHLIADFEVAEPTPATQPAYLASFAGTLPTNTIGVTIRAGARGCATVFDYSAPIAGALELGWPVRCPVAASNSLLATAANATDLPIGFSYAKGVAAFGPGALPVQLSEWQSAGQGALTVTNVPTALVLNALLQARSEGVDFSPGGRLPSLASGSTTRAQLLPYPVGFADSLFVRIDSTPSPEGWTRMLATRKPVDDPSFSFDLTTALPGATSATLDRAVASRPVYRWTAAPGVSAADAAVVRLGWIHQAGSEGSGAVEIPWTFITPPGATSVQVPELPSDVADVASGATLDNISHLVGYLESSLQSDYRAFLVEPARQPQSNTQSLRRELEDIGELRATTWFPGSVL